MPQNHEVAVTFDQTRHDGHPIGIDHLSCSRGVDFAFQTEVDDSIALDQNYGILNWGPLIAVDQHSSHDGQVGIGLGKDSARPKHRQSQ